MLIWEQYDADTWACEWDALNRMALIKKMEDDTYTCVVGTIADMEWSVSADTLTNGKALCVRYMILANNCMDLERLKKLSYKL